jgi:predicted DNA-binding protein with PD1-like motif
MKSKILNSSVPRVHAVIFDKDDEVVSGLEAFAEREQVRAAQITAIGAFREVTLGFFDPVAKEYRRNVVTEQVELVSLIGDFGMVKGAYKLHAHVTVAKANAMVLGGHLLEGRVWPTLEAIVTVLPSYLERRFDPDTELALIAL